MRPSKEKFIYCNSKYPLFFTDPTRAELRYFHIYFDRLVTLYHKRILLNHDQNRIENYQCIIGCGLSVGELALLIIRLKKKKIKRTAHSTRE